MKEFNRLAIIAFIAFTVVYIVGLFVPVLEVDSAQYASISREMADNGSWLQVMHRGENYLDKPPLLFWLSALLFKLFGVSTFLFKLPSYLFTLGGVYATYRLGKKLYNQQTGTVAALLLYGCQAWYLFNNDVRTDTILAACVILAVWQLYEYITDRKTLNFVLAFVFIGLGMLAKGPLGLVIPAMAIGSYLLYQRDWKTIFNPRWLIGIGIVGVLLSPMVYGLYKQYGNEGPLFFFWTQSFGRITGENVWKNDTGYLFFVHTYLWAFLPASVLAIYGLQEKIKAVAKSKMNLLYTNDVLVLAGFILPFIALSLSHYKLPHYIYVVFPFAALLAADAFGTLGGKPQKVFKYLHIVVTAAAFTLTCVFCGMFFPTKNIIVWAVVALGVVGITWLLLNKDEQIKILYPALLAVALFNGVFNAYVYPQLLQYHSTSVIAGYVNGHNIPKDKLFYYREKGHAFDFYTRMIVPYVSPEELNQKPGERWVVTDQQGLYDIRNAGIKVESIKFRHYHIVMLTGKFLNPKTREETLEHRYLLHVIPTNSIPQP